MFRRLETLHGGDLAGHAAVGRQQRKALLGERRLVHVRDGQAGVRAEREAARERERAVRGGRGREHEPRRRHVAVRHRAAAAERIHREVSQVVQVQRRARRHQRGARGRDGVRHADLNVCTF